ncbi:MAG TPA: hypothetical protein PK472_08050 [Pseudomonadota bacterium]|nr:hypothetical protein [Pseudomonadota bacterium]
MNRTRLLGLLGLCLVFVLAGLWIATQGDLLLGLGCAIMFGGGVAIFGLQILDSYREQEAALIDGEVRLPPSVPIHESPLRPRIAMAVMGCFGLGAVLVGIDRQPLLLLIGAALCVLTLVFPFFKAKGYLTSRIMFSPQGIHIIERKRRYLIPFEHIVKMQSAEWNGHLLICIWPTTLDAVVDTVEPADQKESLHKDLLKSEAWMGTPLTLWPTRFGMQGELLLRALHRYISDPSSRQELRPQAALAP